MRTENTEKLLEQLLDEESLEMVRRATLASGLKHVRRRRIRSSILRGSACVCLLSLVLAAVYQGWLSTQAGPDSKSRKEGPAEVQTPVVQVISDDQLFALFPGRPMALVGTPGHQQLVFLDTATSPRPALQQ
jgi:hypothetical protein